MAAEQTNCKAHSAQVMATVAASTLDSILEPLLQLGIVLAGHSSPALEPSSTSAVTS